MDTVTDQGQAAFLGAKPKRVLACMLCHQRKIKCDRRFPCANCQKTNAQCIPAALLPRQRRRRFPERELLDRLRRYEDLLRKHKINFEPLHGSSTTQSASNVRETDDDSQEEAAEEDPASRTAGKGKHSDGNAELAKSYWNAMNQKPQNTGSEEPFIDEDSSSDDVQEKAITSLLDERFEGEEQLFFGSGSENVDLSTLHPDQPKMFKLWQIYLENVDPLLKVTHTITLQARVEAAANNITSIEPNLEALMFSMYCVAVHSLRDVDCRNQFGLPCKNLLGGYHFACRRALMNCGIFRSDNFDGLTALCLYLISSKPNADPRTLFSMLGIAIRIAKRIGIHIEALNSKHDMLEAELRRRLWWVLTMFDERLSEMAGYKDASLAPTWDCRVPSNVNDVDLRTEMKTMPPSRTEPSEAIFTVVNSEIGNFVRRSLFHLDFTNPILKTFITDVRHGTIRRAGELADLKMMIEDRYLKHCNLDVPLHFMTIWGTRMTMAKKFMMNHYSKYAAIPGKQTEEQSDTALGYAIEMLEADTIMSRSSLTDRYTWYLNLYFPFPAFIHIVQDIRKRPGSNLVEQAWHVLSENYDVRFLDSEYDDGMFYRVFPKIIMATWAARKEWLKRSGFPIPVPPSMVTSIQMVTAAMDLASLSPNEDTSILIPEMTVHPKPAVPMFHFNEEAAPPSSTGLSMLPDSFWDFSQLMDLEDPQMNWPGMNWPAAL